MTRARPCFSLGSIVGNGRWTSTEYRTRYGTYGSGRGVFASQGRIGARVGSHAIDFVLGPGVAFDTRGALLGYGGGFYDKLLADGLSPGAWLVAGAFESQMVEKVPLDEHDVPMDVVVTENGHYPLGPLPRWANYRGDAQGDQ